MRKMIIDIYPSRARPKAQKAFLVRRGARSLALILFVTLTAVAINAIGNTTAYYFDSEISRGNFFAAASLDFTVGIEKSDNRFQTFTQGGWGSVARGDNPGAYRDANFAAAFPSGAVIGAPDPNFSATFTDAKTVEDFLPAGAAAMFFTQNHINSTSTEAGVLAGQALALTLNVGFDLYDVNFAPSADNLKDYIVNDASLPCDGMTGQEVLDEANAVLGGLASSFSPPEINECATWINEKFAGGGEDGLAPGGSISQFAIVVNGGSLDFQYTVETEKTGGDDDFCQALNLEARLEGVSRYTGSLLTFVSSPVTHSVSADEWEFVISLPLDAAAAGNCSFDFIFSGWQTTLPEFGGFSNRERVDDPVYSVVRSITSVIVESEQVTTTEAIMTEATTIPIVIEEATTTEPLVATSTEPFISIEATTTIEVIEATSSPTVIEIETEDATSTPEVIEAVVGEAVEETESPGDEPQPSPEATADEEDRPVETVEVEPAPTELEPAPIEESVEPPAEASPPEAATD